MRLLFYHFNRDDMTSYTGLHDRWGGKGCEVTIGDLCKPHHPLNFHPYTLRRMNIFDQKMPLEVTF